MGFNCGIVGLPNVGKSTLFNALTRASVPAENYPFCTIDPNIGIVPVPDKRLLRLADIYKPQKIVPTTLEFVDIAGLVKGSSKGEGLGNQFLSHIRNVDAIAHVVRCFEDSNVAHVSGNIQPVNDIEIVETELILKDVETIEKKHVEIQKRLHANDKKAKLEEKFYEALKNHLLTGKLAKTFTIHETEEQVFLRELHLLTSKPVMYICNIHEKDLNRESDYIKQVKEIATKENSPVIVISAEIEAEIAQLTTEEERQAFIEELGLKESGLNQVIREGYALLDLITFFTTGDKEVHARTVKKGTTAIQAAGKIHSDFERGFIRAEIIKFTDIDKLGSEVAVKEAGLLHIEGRDYILKDGDVMFVRFNV